MPIFQELLNFDKIFHTLSEPPIIINELLNSTEADKETISELITTRYSSDMISLLPSCRCGLTKGEFSVEVKCEHCGTLVKSSFENDIEPNVWFKKPFGVSKLINPIILMMLKNRFKKSGYNIIQWLIDTSYAPQTKQPPVISKLKEMGQQRGYNNFIENFNLIMQNLFAMKDFKLKKPDKEDYLYKLIFEEQEKVFSDFIPLPNKALLIIESNNLGVYVDEIIVDAIDAIMMLTSIDKTHHDQNIKSKENRTAKAIFKLTEFYEAFFKRNLSPKSGQFRKHIFASRTNFSFRAVITSLTDTHSYDEIHVPWGIGVTAFRPHLLNKLLKLGLDLNSAIGMLLGAVENYNPLLDQLLQELISESPNGSGLVAILQRNRK